LVKDNQTKEITNNFLDLNSSDNVNKSVLMAFCDESGKFIYVNEVLRNFIISENDILPYQFQDIIRKEEDIQLVNKIFEDLVSSHESKNIITDIELKNNGQALIEWNISVFESTINSINKSIMLVGNLISSKTINLEIIRHRNRYADAQRIGQMGHWDWNIRDNTLMWSDEIYRIFGLKPREFKGTYEAFLAIVHPEDRDFVISSVDRAIKNQDKYDIEHRIKLQDGSIKTVREVGEVTFEDGIPIMMIGAVQDITKYKNLENLLIQKNFHKDLLSSLNQYSLKHQNILDLYNKTMHTITQIDNYLDFQIWINEEYTNSVIRYYDSTKKIIPKGISVFSKKIHDGEHPVTHNILSMTDEEKHYFKSIILDDEQVILSEIIRGRKILGIMKFKFKDIDSLNIEDETFINSISETWANILERKRNQTRFKKMQEQRERDEKMEGLGKLAGGISHDFNNYLTVILGYSEISMYSDNIEEIKTNIQAILSAGNKAKDLSLQLLGFGKKLYKEKSLYDMNQLINEFKPILARLVFDNVNISYEQTHGKLPIMVNPTQIQQILINIVGNANDAISDNGMIKIATRRLDLDEDLELGLPMGNYVNIEITDNGTGMDEDTMKRVFEPYFSKKGDKGTGLGMATVFNIIKELNGGIKIYSKLQIGTSFSIYIPTSTEIVDLKHEVDTQNLNYNIPDDLHVLVVEDNFEIRTLIKKILGKYNAFIYTAEDGLEAINKAYNKIDLIISDILMPNLSSEKMIDELRKDHPIANVIFISGYDEESILENFKDESVEFISKPFTEAKLLSRISQLYIK